MRIGIFGGSFNPIHNAHTTIAEHFVNELDLDKCFFVPTFISPFRQEEANQVSPDDRLSMVRLAIEGKEKFDIDDFEINNKGISYTINTIFHFKDKYPNAKLFLLIGGDQAEKFDNWYNWQEILYNAQLCIARRPLADYNSNSIFMKFAVASEPPIFIEAPLMEISSSIIKEKLKSKEEISQYLDSKVIDYIKANKLY
jgi:nicotinate-nucleotide adenylyltransferase